MLPLIFTICWYSCILSVAFADGQFDEPDRQKTDFEVSYTAGDTLNIKWRQGWFGSDDQPDFVDLFITWFASDSFSMLLIANTTTKQPGFFPWKINITENVLNADNKFVLRFRPHRDPKDYNNAGPMSPSKGFLILQKEEKVLSSSSKPSSITTPTHSPTMTSTVATATPTVTSKPKPKSTTTFTPTPNTPKKNTNIGAIIGGAIGGVAVIILCIIVCLQVKVLRQKRNKQAEIYEAAGRAYTQGYQGPPQELADPNVEKYQYWANTTALVEKDALVEIDGRQIPAEIVGKKPGKVAVVED